MRSIALPDGSISSAFLDLFGRSPRDTGLEEERNNRPTAEQRLHCSIPATSCASWSRAGWSPPWCNPTKTPREIATRFIWGFFPAFPRRMS
jgi:hypothetical protein